MASSITLSAVAASVAVETDISSTKVAEAPMTAALISVSVTVIVSELESPS